MDSVVHFELTANSIKRATKFYSSVFGWRIQDVPGMNYSMVTTTSVDKKMMPKKRGAINGGLVKKDKSASSPVIVIKVKFLSDSLRKIKRAGGRVVMPKVKVAKMGYYARVKDSEGNVIGIWQDI